MGFDTARFVHPPEDELICSICSSVLEDPLMTVECEHLFCSDCIFKWISRSTARSCPIDRTPINVTTGLKPAPRAIRNLLARLELRCDYAASGCQYVSRLEQMEKHAASCDFNPRKQVRCNMWCERLMAREELERHNCYKDLKMTMAKKDEEIMSLKRQRDMAFLFTLLFLMIVSIQLLPDCWRDILIDFMFDR